MSIRAPEFTSTNNPSKRSRMKRRGPKKHFYTVEDIAREVGLKASSVRATACHPTKGFDLDDLGQVVSYINRYIQKRACPFKDVGNGDIDF